MALSTPRGSRQMDMQARLQGSLPAGINKKEADMKILHWSAGVLAAFAVIIILLITSFEVAMYADYSVYEEEYKKYDVLSLLDMKMEDAMTVTVEMMEYLRGNRETLSVVTTVDGERQDFFNGQDRLHMADVQGLFLGGLRLRIGAAVILALCFMVLIATKADWRNVLSFSYWIAFGIFAVIAGILGIAVAYDFSSVFTLFHEIFFTNDLWVFNPATDYMIRMLPEGLFFDMVLRVGLLLGAWLVLLLGISIIVMRKKR